MTCTDAQVRLAMRERSKGRTQEQAAVKANIKSRKTVAKYEQRGQLPSELTQPRRYRTRADPFERASTERRPQQHLDRWEQLSRQAKEHMERLDAFDRITREVDAWFVLIDLETGQPCEVTTDIHQLETLGEQLHSWSGRIYQKLSCNLQNWAPSLFSHQPILAQRADTMHAAVEKTGRFW